MADRLDYYFRQKVTEAELDLAFVRVPAIMITGLRQKLELGLTRRAVERY